MTAPLFSGRGRRSVAALGAVSAGLLVLSACDKPTPLATVTVGSTSVTTEAGADCRDAAELASLEKVQQCITEPTDPKNIDYTRGDTLRMGVEPEMVEDGKKWSAFLDGQPITDTSTNTYKSFPNVDIFGTGGQGGQAPPSKVLSIMQFNDEGKPASIWSFKLNVKS
ncbi:DUF2771 domain-containing protein [Streptomyces sp. NPDC090022]|uniref:DUF2771 domain-containing protein n=1 Tax=Streptomyces sp. NPDC090022 TaxID=3365920 RepID=UPI003820F083